VKASSHNLDRLRIDFDAPGLVANAGLVLPATLAQHLGLPALLRQHVRLGKVAGAANPDRKALTVIASLLGGGEWVDDVNALRVGGLGAEVLGVAPAAASTVGTFLRAFTAGHVRQLDAVQEDLHQRAWESGARPQEPTLKLDLDSTVIETYGLLKQGGKHFTYQQTRGYHPLLATISRRAARWSTRGCARAEPRPVAAPPASPARRWPEFDGERPLRSWSGPTPASTRARWWRRASDRAPACRSRCGSRPATAS